VSAVAAEAQRVRGPAALAGDRGRFWNLATTLAVTDFKLRFFGSALGYLWTLVRPLLFFGVLYVVFTRLVRVGGGVAHYPSILLTAIVLYTFFAEATATAVTSVVDRESLVRKVQFPRLVIPLSTTLTAGFNLLANLVAVFVFLLLQGITPHWGWLELPLLVALLFALAAGAAALVSALYVPFRDVKPIWEVGLQALFYATPVIYPYEVVRDHSVTAAHLVMCNPLAAIIQQTRHAVIDPAAPSAAAAIGGAPYLLIPLGIIVAVCVAGYAVFDRMAPRIAEEL
jgi:ABC-2 type transport system permease protein